MKKMHSWRVTAIVYHTHPLTLSHSLYLSIYFSFSLSHTHFYLFMNFSPELTSDMELEIILLSDKIMKKIN